MKNKQEIIEFKQKIERILKIPKLIALFITVFLCFFCLLYIQAYIQGVYFPVPRDLIQKNLEAKRDRLVQKEQEKLGKARNLWEHQNINSYKLQLGISLGNGFDSNAPTCAIDIHVRNRTQVEITQNTCIDTKRNGYLPKSIYPGFCVFCLAPGTIDEIFNSLKNAVEVESYAPNGIDCDGFYLYSIKYDSRLGYPLSVKASHYPGDGTYPCTLLGTVEVYPEYTISVTPLP